MFVLIMWSEYHNFNQAAQAVIADNEEKLLEMSESYLDKVVEVPSLIAAKEVAAAFRKLAAADWTPNQTSEDKDENFYVRQEAKEILRKHGAI